jgi:hypothetical protein
MSGPLPQPSDTPDTLAYRHLRSIAGLCGMIGGVALFVLIYLTRQAHDDAYQAALLAKACPAPTSVAVPNTVLQLIYVFAIPVGMPLVIFIFGVMLFSPSVFAQLKGLVPWVKNG